MTWLATDIAKINPHQVGRKLVQDTVVVEITHHVLSHLEELFDLFALLEIANSSPVRPCSFYVKSLSMITLTTRVDHSTDSVIHHHGIFGTPHMVQHAIENQNVGVDQQRFIERA